MRSQREQQHKEYREVGDDAKNRERESKVDGGWKA